MQINLLVMVLIYLIFLFQQISYWFSQIASRISGSFNKGFTFSGEISGSVTSTGSFGRIEAGFLHGDGSSIKDDLPRSNRHYQ